MVLVRPTGRPTCRLVVALLDPTSSLCHRRRIGAETPGHDSTSKGAGWKRKADALLVFAFTNLFKAPAQESQHAPDS
jgi:hypothetical protein